MPRSVAELTESEKQLLFDKLLTIRDPAVWRRGAVYFPLPPRVPGSDHIEVAVTDNEALEMMHARLLEGNPPGAFPSLLPGPFKSYGECTVDELRAVAVYVLAHDFPRSRYDRLQLSLLSGTQVNFGFYEVAAALRAFAVEELRKKATPE